MCGNGIARLDVHERISFGAYGAKRGLTDEANWPRADGAAAPPASGPVERVVSRRIGCSSCLK
jgi:hypothetical protein